MVFALRRCTHLSQDQLYLHSSKRAISFSFLFFLSHAIKFYLPLNEKCHENIWFEACSQNLNQSHPLLFYFAHSNNYAKMIDQWKVEINIVWLKNLHLLNSASGKGLGEFIITVVDCKTYIRILFVHREET